MSTSSPSGCCFTWQNGEMKVERYYEVTYKIDESKTLEEWEELIAKPLLIGSGTSDRRR